MPRPHQIDRVGQGAGEHQRCAQHDAPLLRAHVVQEHQRDPGVAQRQRRDDIPADGAFVQQCREQHRHGRIEEQDQALQPCGDVLQAEEIEKAGQVITDQAQPQHQQTIMRIERFGMTPPGPDRHADEERHREHHAQSQQRHRIHAVEIRQLHQDRLGRKTDRREQREDDAEKRIPICEGIACMTCHDVKTRVMDWCGSEAKATRSTRSCPVYE